MQSIAKISRNNRVLVLILVLIVSAFLMFSCSDPSTVTDIDGNVYQIVKIGDQWWMAENLKVTHYRNGDEIPNVTNNSTWADFSSGAYCYYNNDRVHVDNYGALYNWYAVDDSRGLVPEGWHVPTDGEITQLTIFLGGNAGSKLAGRYDLWTDGGLRNNPNFASSGFSFLPGGYRNGYSGYFYNMSYAGNFWSSTEYGSNNAWRRLLYYFGTAVLRNNYDKRSGLSVRCVRD